MLDRRHDGISQIQLLVAIVVVVVVVTRDVQSRWMSSSDSIFRNHISAQRDSDSYIGISICECEERTANR